MESKEKVSTSLSRLELTDVDRICCAIGRSRASVLRLLVRAGLRVYRRSGNLFCGYPNCTRKDCCAGDRKGRPAELLEFRQLRLLDGGDTEH